MLILSTEHPHFARCKAFAQSQGIPVHEISVPSEDSSFLPLLKGELSRVMLALPASLLEPALYAWLFAPEETRAQCVVCIGEEFSDATLARAWEEPVPARALMMVDHNLAARETVAWGLAWGAAVPLFESRAMQKDQGLLQRARAAASTFQEMRKALDGTQAWTLQRGDEPAHESRAGFIVDAYFEVPRVVQEFAEHREGLWHTEAKRWSAWNSVLSAGATSWMLRGDGAWWMNGKSMRARRTDVFSLRKVSGVHVRFVGSA